MAQSCQFFQSLTETLKHTFSFHSVSSTPNAPALRPSCIANAGALNACDAALRCAAAVPALHG
jgi:hypothetical protein